MLDFTAQHRCAWAGDPGALDAPSGLVGRVVVATGAYRDLQGRGGVASVDEAVPVVALSRRARDPRVLGVVSAVEPPGQDYREFRVGHVAFGLPRTDRRVVVNAGGEGAVLVSAENGRVRNGDLLVSSSRPGVAMRQGDDVVRACTLAKATCDAPPARGPPRLIGCTYK